MLIPTNFKHINTKLFMWIFFFFMTNDWDILRNQQGIFTLKLCRYFKARSLCTLIIALPMQTNPRLGGFQVRSQKLVADSECHFVGVWHGPIWLICLLERCGAHPLSFQRPLWNRSLREPGWGPYNSHHHQIRGHRDWAGTILARLGLPSHPTN